MTLSILFDDSDRSNGNSNASNPVATALAAVARAVAAWRAERSRYLALNDLLAMDPRLLRDIGLSADDVRRALIR